MGKQLKSSFLTGKELIPSMAKNTASEKIRGSLLLAVGDPQNRM